MMYALKPLIDKSEVTPAPIMYPMKSFHPKEDDASTSNGLPIAVVATATAVKESSPKKEEKGEMKGGAKPAKGERAERGVKKDQLAASAQIHVDPKKMATEQDDILRRLKALKLDMDALKANPPAKKAEPIVASTSASGRSGDLVLTAPPRITYVCWLLLLLDEIRTENPEIGIRVLGHSSVVPELQSRFRLANAVGCGQTLTIVWKAGADDWSLDGVGGWDVVERLGKLGKMDAALLAQAMLVLRSPKEGLEALTTALGFSWKWVQNGGFKTAELLLAVAALTTKWESVGPPRPFSAPVQAWLSRTLNAAGPDFARYLYPKTP